MKKPANYPRLVFAVASAVLLLTTLLTSQSAVLAQSAVAGASPGGWGGFGDHGGGRSLYVSPSGSSRASDRLDRPPFRGHVLS